MPRDKCSLAVAWEDPWPFCRPLLPEFVVYKWWDPWPSHQPISLVAMQEQNAVWNGLKQSLVSPIFSPGCMHVWRGTLACIDFISFYFELIKRAFHTGINAIVLISIIDMAGVFVCSRCFLDLNGVLRKLKFRQDTEANTQFSFKSPTYSTQWLRPFFE